MRSHRPGTFKKGHKKVGGRQKGTRNRFNRDLIDAIVQAADQVGADGRGKKGVDGYLQKLAGKTPGYFVGLLRQAVIKQVPAPEQPENPVVYRSEQDLRQALLDRGVHRSLLPPPARDPREQPPPVISPPNSPPGWQWTLRRSEETVEPDTVERAAAGTDDETEMSARRAHHRE